MYISGLKMKDAQGFCLDDAPPASDEDDARAVRAKFLVDKMQTNQRINCTVIRDPVHNLHSL